MQGNRGFTLYELLITLGLTALLLSIAVPSFTATLARSRQAVELNALFHAVHLARKESILRRKVVSLCPSAGGQRCDPGTDWSAGWILFENADRDSPPQVDPGEMLLKDHRVSDGYPDPRQSAGIHVTGHLSSCHERHLRGLRPPGAGSGERPRRQLYRAPQGRFRANRWQSVHLCGIS